MTKREEQKEKRRQDILRAGLKLFACKGYEATKINDIATEAGMSLGLLYHYFESVEILYEELISIALLGRTGQYFPPYENSFDYFVQSASHIFEVVQSDHMYAEYFVLVNQAQRNQNLPIHIKEKLKLNDIIAQSMIHIEEGQRQGIIRDGNPMALALTFWLSIEAYVEMIALHPEIPFPETNWFVDLLRVSSTTKSNTHFKEELYDSGEK